MATFILIIIYVVFIGLGLPNSLLGSAWPLMQADIGVSFESAGLISMLISLCMIISSFLSGKLITRFGHAKVTLASLMLIAISVLGFWALPSFVWFCIAALPLGLGSGAMDATLNHYVSSNYASSHMNWLHCFWGVGAAIGPVIMGQFMDRGNAWREGYFIIGIIELCMVAGLFASLPLWKRKGSAEIVRETPPMATKGLLRIPGVKVTFLFFFSNSAAEMCIGLWGSSYLVTQKGFSTGSAAMWISIFYLGLTAGRILAGFIAMTLSNKALIRSGLGIGMAGTCLMMLGPGVFAIAGLMIMGLGFAPLVPCMLQETPRRFGEKEAQYIIGFQMASVFTGGAFIPPLVGLMAGSLGIYLLPISTLVFFALMIASSESMHGWRNGQLTMDN